MSHSSATASSATAPAAAAVAAPATSARKPRGRGHERRREILQAATKLFAEHGIDTVSTRRIATEVGISQTALYVYFATKDAILEALCDASFQQLIEAFRRDLAQGRDARDRLQRLMRSYVQFGLAHPDEYRLVFMTAQVCQNRVPDFNAPPQTQDIGTQCFLVLFEAVRDFCATCAPNADPWVLAQTVWAGGHGLVALMITVQDFPWAERSALLETSIAVLLNGMAQTYK